MASMSEQIRTIRRRQIGGGLIYGSHCLGARLARCQTRYCKALSRCQTRYCKALSKGIQASNCTAKLHNETCGDHNRRADWPRRIVANNEARAARVTT